MDDDDAEGHAAAPDSVLTLMAETVAFEVQRRPTGLVRVATRTETLTQDVTADVEAHGVLVTRVPIGRDIAVGESLPQAREEGDTTIVPVFEEVLVVEKRLRLVEEVHIRRTITRETLTVPVTLRRQVADIVREGDTGSPDQTPT